MWSNGEESERKGRADGYLSGAVQSLTTMGHLRTSSNVVYRICAVLSHVVNEMLAWLQKDPWLVPLLGSFWVVPAG